MLPAAIVGLVGLGVAVLRLAYLLWIRTGALQEIATEPHLLSSERRALAQAVLLQTGRPAFARAWGEVPGQETGLDFLEDPRRGYHSDPHSQDA